MARKKKTKTRKKDAEGRLKPEVKTSIWTILAFVAGAFFVLAGFEKAGVVGHHLFSALSFLLGTGYFLFPLFFFVLGISLIRPGGSEFALHRVIGSLVFLFSGLGIVELLFAEKGGFLGNIIAQPLLSLFDFYVSLVLLLALIIISGIVVFEQHLTPSSFAFWNMFKKKEKEETSVEPNISTGETTPLEEPKKKSAFSLGFGSKKKDAPAKPTQATNANGDDIKMSVIATDKEYKAPSLKLLETATSKPGVGDVKASANLIKRTLQNFGIDVEMDEISIGPTVTRYALKPAEGVRLSKIVGLQNNLELALAAHPVRIEAPIPGKSLVGIEVPNTKKATVRLSELISSSEFKESQKPLMFSLGKGITGRTYVSDLAKAPHLLVAGATGSGKSVTMHALIVSLLFRNSPYKLKFIMVDPKRVELTLYNGIPHLLTPVITDAKKAILALKWAAKEMERRYEVLEGSRVRDITSYHETVLPKLLKENKKDSEKPKPDPMPYIIVVIDELADLMQTYGRELESVIVQLAQKSRAVGIHLILSTQRPSVNVITGLIKANIPSRIALQVTSQVDSRTILDGIGAEKLLGAGDMLYLSSDMSKPVRIQSAFISEGEVGGVSKFLADQYQDELQDEVDITSSESKSKTDIFDESAFEEGPEEEDELYNDAREIVMHAGKASTSYLQRKLRVGYARAARLMDLLEEQGIIGPPDGSKPRELLVDGVEEDTDDDE